MRGTYSMQPTTDNVALQQSEQVNLVSNGKYKCVNDDELPPDYDSIIKGDTSDTPNKPKQGMGCISGLKATAHLKAWMLTISILLSAIFYAVWPFLAALWIMMLILFYIAYLVESFCFSSSFKYIKNTYVQESVYEYISRLQTYKPRIWWNIVCYHYETRYRTVTDSDGNSRTESYQEMVITHTASKNYEYATWQDVSAPMPQLDEWNLTKLTNYKTFSFSDTATENDYNQKAADFRANNNFDVYQTFSFGVEIKDFLSKMLVEIEPGTKSEIVSMPYYVISTIFLFTTCYRMYFAAVCGRQKYAFNKQISIFDSYNSGISEKNSNDVRVLPAGIVETVQLSVQDNSERPQEINVNLEHLPIGWKECYTNDGEVYYQNNITEETQWERPTTNPLSSGLIKQQNVSNASNNNADRLPNGWVTCFTLDGKPYYQNNSNKTTQWEHPKQ